MARPLLIIELTDSEAHAGVIKNGQSVFQSISGEPVKSLSLVLEKLKELSGLDFSSAVVGLPPSMVSLRTISTPFLEKKKLDEVIGFEAGESFLKPMDELVLSTRLLSNNKAIAAAVEKDALKEVLSILKNFRIDPVWVTSSLLSKDRLLKPKATGEVMAYVDASSFIAADKTGTLFIKPINGANELKLGMTMLETEDFCVKRFLATAEGGKLLNSIGKKSEDIGIEDSRAGIDALAAHFNADFEKDAVNFRTGEFANTIHIDSAKKGFKLTAALFIAFILIWSGYSYFQRQAINNSAKLARAEMENSYKELFNSSPADPHYQLEIKLKELKDERVLIGSSINIPEIMRLMASVPAADRAEIYRLQAQGKKVIANGEAASFESANRFKDALLQTGGFSEVNLTDTKTAASGRVAFSISMSVK